MTGSFIFESMFSNFVNTDLILVSIYTIGLFNFDTLTCKFSLFYFVLIKSYLGTSYSELHVAWDYVYLPKSSCIF